MNKNKNQVIIEDFSENNFNLLLLSSIDAEWISTKNNENVSFISVQIVHAMYDMVTDELKHIRSYIFIDIKYVGKLKEQDIERMKLENPGLTISYIDLSHQGGDFLLDENVKKGVNLFHETIHEYCLYFDRYLFSCRDEYTGKKIFNCSLFMYFSPNDLIATMTLENLYEALLEGYIEQGKGVIGVINFEKDRCIIKTKIFDLIGLGNSSLKNYVISLGLDTSEKDSLDDYKNDMGIALEELTYTFLKYALNDCNILFHCYLKNIKLINDIIKNTLQLPDVACFDFLNIPVTTGALVRDIFLKCLLYMDYKNDDDLLINKAVFCKLGVLKLQNNDEILSIYLDLFYGFIGDETTELTNNDVFQKFLKNYSILQSKYQYKNIGGEKGTAKCFTTISEGIFSSSSYEFKKYFEFSGVSCSTIEHFLVDRSLSSRYNIIRFGGRTSNERYKEFKLEYTADVDLVSCYATTLKSQIYPLGHPTIYAKTSTQVSMTLGDFIRINNKELVDGLWMVIVSGKIDFQQDLIPSRNINDDWYKEIYKKIDKNIDVSDYLKNVGEAYMLRTEIVNGVITTDVFNILKKVCTNNEFKGFLSLKVVTGVYHKKSDRIDNWNEWRALILKDKGIIKIINNDKIDDRSRKWYPFKLSTIVEKLLVDRNKYKKIGDIPKSNSIKLLLNTLYGVLSSPYFRVNNVIVTNNITAKGRVNIWMISKALCITQSITDGGCSGLMQVLYMKKYYKKPGMDYLSDYYKLIKHKSIYQKSLGGFDWVVIFKQYEPDYLKMSCDLDIDKMFLKHVNDFWSVYGLSLFYDIETKKENFCKIMGFINKSDYVLRTITGDVFKVRGSKANRGYIEHPGIRILRSVINNDDFEHNFGHVAKLYYLKEEIMTIKKWVMSRLYIYYKLYNIGKKKNDLKRFTIKNEPCKTELTWSEFKDFIKKNREGLKVFIDTLNKQNPGTRVFTLIKTYTLQDRISPYQNLNEALNRDRRSKRSLKGYEIFLKDGLETVYSQMHCGKGLRGINNKRFYDINLVKLYDSDFIKYIDNNYTNEDMFMEDSDNLCE